MNNFDTGFIAIVCMLFISCNTETYAFRHSELQKFSLKNKTEFVNPKISVVIGGCIAEGTK